jgi:thiol-disulfide isomerase/thioredoxin
LSGKHSETLKGNTVSEWIRTFKYLFALAAACLLCGPVVTAEPVNSVKRMTLTELEKMMKNPQNRHMVVAMASWCRPCREELPILDALYGKYREQGFKIVGISLDEGGPDAMQPVVDKAKVSFPVYWVGDQAVEKFDIYAVPMLYFIKDGRVVEKIPGKRSESYLDKKIRKLLR